MRSGRTLANGGSGVEGSYVSQSMFSITTANANEERKSGVDRRGTVVPQSNTDKDDLLAEQQKRAREEKALLQGFQNMYKRPSGGSLHKATQVRGLAKAGGAAAATQ